MHREASFDFTCASIPGCGHRSLEVVRAMVGGVTPVAPRPGTTPTLDDTTNARIGNQRYEIPDAVLLGG